jgi:hypothetical protein
MTKVLPCRNASKASRWYEKTDADLLTATARLIADDNRAELANFGAYGQCLGKVSKSESSHPKYRKASGYGNNLKNPYWGSTGAAYGRIGPKRYYDGVNYIRKSITGCCLPCARRIVTNILMKAEIKNYQGPIPNDMSNFAGLYISHDIAAQAMERMPKDKCEDMRCCFKENGVVLPELMLNSACLPIQIGKDDVYYSQHNVECLNFIRSEKVSMPNTNQFGEIKNKATGFLDLSLIYGNENSEMQSIRTFVGGKLRMNDKNLMAVDDSNDYS